MSKNKVKGSGSFIKKETVHWRLQLQQLDVNTIRPERNIKVVILNECLTKYFDDIAKFQEHAYTYTCADVKPIIFEEILYIISHYPAWSRPYIENDVENMIKEACAEAKSYIKMKKPIPLDMMADLIKLRIIMLIEEDIYNEKLLHMNLLDETMSTDLSDFCETTSNSSTEEDEKTAENFVIEQNLEKGNDCKTSDPIMEFNPQNTSCINGNLRNFETVDVFFSTSSIILQQYLKTQWKRHEEETGSRRPSIGFTPIITADELSIPKRKKLRTPWSIRLCKSLKQKKENLNLSVQTGTYFKETKLLFIILTGFYDPYLIISLYKASVPVSCVINIAMKEDKLLDPTEVTSTKRFTLLTPFSVAPVYNYSLQCLYTQSKNVVRICDLGYEEMKEQLIYHFWSTLDELSVSNYEIIKDLITVVCPPVDYRGTYVKPESVEYVEQSKTIFCNIRQLLYKLPVFKKWYSDYTNSLQILDLGDTPEIIPTNEMFYYNETLDKIPTDCYNVGLTVEGLLEEVEEMNSGNEKKFGCVSVSHENQLAKKKERDRLLKIRRFCNKFCKKYQFKLLPSNILSFFQKYRSSFLLSKKKPYCPERFEITEGNSLALNAIYYPRFIECICSRTLSDLEKSMPFALRKLTDDMQRMQTESIFSSNQHHAWSSLLRLSPQEINERLEICMFNLLKCGRDDIKAEPFCGLYNYFPISTQSDVSILLNREVPSQTTCLSSPEHIYEHYDKTSFEWQESLETDLLLQKLEKYRYIFKCMDYEFIPLSNSIITRFHDKCDDFGTATEVWKQGLRSQAGMRDFFKSIIFEDSCALLFSHMQICKSCEKALMSCAVDVTLLASNPVDALAEESISSTPLINSSNRQTSAKFNTGEALPPRPPHLMNAFNLCRRHEARCISTTFRSLDGLTVTVEKTFSFNVKPCLKLKLETNHHKAFMYVQQYKDSKFIFHIEAANGARVVFSQPETRTYNEAHNIITTRKPRPKPQRYYDLKEIETIKFGERLCLYEMHFLNELSLLRILNEYLPLENLSSTETLQLLDFRRSIVLKPTASLTDMRWRYNVPKAYSTVLKTINRIKRESIPHFRIISTALHKHRYIVVAPLKIKVSFANGERILKYTPNLITKKKIEITKCVPLLSKLKDRDDEDEDIQHTIDNNENECGSYDDEFSECVNTPLSILSPEVSLRSKSSCNGNTWILARNFNQFFVPRSV